MDLLPTRSGQLLQEVLPAIGRGESIKEALPREMVSTAQKRSHGVEPAELDRFAQKFEGIMRSFLPTLTKSLGNTEQDRSVARQPSHPAAQRKGLGEPRASVFQGSFEELLAQLASGRRVEPEGEENAQKGLEPLHCIMGQDLVTDRNKILMGQGARLYLVGELGDLVLQ